MKLLFSSPGFYPDIGGIENLVLHLAHYLSKKGHTIWIITDTIVKAPEDFPFKIYRNPSLRKRMELIQKSNLQVYFNLNKKEIIPFLLLRTPLVVSLHGPLKRGFLASIKKGLIKYKADACTACSQFVANSCEGSVIIHSGYDNELFQKTNERTRSQDIVFVGRLVPEKGCGLLLKSLVILREMNISPTLSIIGNGPEKLRLINQVKILELDKQVTFSGIKRGAELVEILNKHKILVIPSVWKEPFGIVALEGIACGCLVIGSDGGGLKEAIGPCGITFPNGNANALATLLKTTLTNPGIIDFHQKQAPEHLKKFQQDYIAERYLNVFKDVLAKR